MPSWPALLSGNPRGSAAQVAERLRGSGRSVVADRSNADTIARRGRTILHARFASTAGHDVKFHGLFF
jgi:hypothetical protein